MTVQGRPTLLSNAETWARLGLLALEGLGPTLARGTGEEPGTTLLTTHAPLADALPAHVRGGPVLVGGFHGTWTTWHAVAGAPVSARRIKELGVALGAGVVIAPGPAACPLALTEQVVAHLAAQSAQRCGPCFNGLPALARAVGDLAAGRPGARPEVERLVGLVTGRGACAHPDGTARLVRSLLTALPDEVAAHEHRSCSRTARAGRLTEVAS